MIINRVPLLAAAPIVNMVPRKETAHGVTYGLTEAGYDIRIKQRVHFIAGQISVYTPSEQHALFVPEWQKGRFVLASSIEEFTMPDNLVGKVHDKSTWARRGLSVFNTVIEPGWKGFLTLELVYHGEEELVIPAGAGIAQVLFEDLTHPASYRGRYQNQADCPVPAKEAR